MRCFSYFLWIVRFLYFILFYHALKKTVKFQFIRAHRLRPWRCCLSFFSILMCAQIAFAMAVKPLIPILMCAQVASIWPREVYSQMKHFNSHVRTDCVSGGYRRRPVDRFNSHVRTDCVIAYQLFQCDIEFQFSCARRLHRRLWPMSQSIRGFNSLVRTGCVHPLVISAAELGCFNSHVRTGCVVLYCAT